MVMSDQSKIQFRQNAVLALRSFVEGRKAYYTDDVKITAQNYQDKKHFDHLCLLIEEIEYLEKELGNQDEVLQMIRNWCEAYPIDIFTKPDYSIVTYFISPSFERICFIFWLSLTKNCRDRW